jgi:hypothetical protein
MHQENLEIQDNDNKNHANRVKRLYIKPIIGIIQVDHDTLSKHNMTPAENTKTNTTNGPS